MKINNKFEIAQEVYLIHDIDQCKRMITEIRVNQNGIVYILSCGEAATDHFECEISTSKGVI